MEKTTIMLNAKDARAISDRSNKPRSILPNFYKEVYEVAKMGKYEFEYYPATGERFDDKEFAQLAAVGYVVQYDTKNGCYYVKW